MTITVATWVIIWLLVMVLVALAALGLLLLAVVKAVDILRRENHSL